MSIIVIGDGALAAKLAASPAQARVAAQRGVVKAGHALLNRSQPLVPVQDGFLKGSGSVQWQVTADGASAHVGYGGAASAYARRQHYEDDWNHTVGQSRYLEEPASEFETEFVRILTAEFSDLT